MGRAQALKAVSRKPTAYRAGSPGSFARVIPQHGLDRAPRLSAQLIGLHPSVSETTGSTATVADRTIRDDPGPPTDAFIVVGLRPC